MSSAKHTTSQLFSLNAIPSVNPSLVEVLRNCPLQAHVSRITGMRMFALGNPKAWLGTAYHKVLEKLWIGMNSDLTEEQLVERLWTSAIDALQQRAVAHPLDRRFAVPEKRPG